MRPKADRTPGRGGMAGHRALSALCCCLFGLLAACGPSGGTSPGGHATPTPTLPTSSSPLVTYKGHAGPVISVAWSPDGARVASCGNDGTAQVWQASDGKALWQAHVAQYAFAVAWAPDGKALAAAGSDGVVGILDAATGQQAASLAGRDGAVEGLAWSPDGKLLAAGSQVGTVTVWDVRTGTAVVTYRGHTDAVERIAWSPDGTRLASASYDGTVHVWDVKTGQAVLIYKGHAAPVWEVAWSPDGRRIASGTGAAGAYGPVTSNNSIKVWDAATGQTLLTYTGAPMSVQAYALAWSPNGKLLASGGDDKLVRVWDAVTGQTRMEYRGHTSIIFTVAWSPDGTRIASASVDGTAQIWRVEG